jgi:glycosyltransferase involved in cell wall biosynthesis
MRIAALIYENMLGSIYRGFVPMQALAHRGHTVHIEERMEPSNPAALREFDVVQFCRSCNHPMQVLARQLRRAGVVTVWDNDDDVTTTPKDHATNTALRGTTGRRIHAAMTEMMRSVDLVTVPTAPLAARYRRAVSTAKIHVLENYLPPTFERPERVMPHGSAVRIGWLATREHRDTYERLQLREAFDRLLTRHAQVELVGIGLDLELASNRYFHIPGASHAELPNVLSRLDFAIAPLADLEFNAIRSNVKLKEYAAVGLPWLASPIGPYAQMGEAQGGRLVEDEAWYQELDALVVDADDRRRLAYRARQWADGERIEQHVERYEELLENAVGRAHARALR